LYTSPLPTLSHHRDHYSFPTRRSSDLAGRVGTERNRQNLSHHRAVLYRLQRRDAELSVRASPCKSAYTENGQGGSRTPDTRIFRDRKSTRLNSSHVKSSYAVFCLKKKK